MAQKFIWVFPSFFNVRFDPLFLNAVLLFWRTLFVAGCGLGLGAARVGAAHASCCAQALHCGGFFVAGHCSSHLSSCARLPRGTWNLSWSGIEPVPPLAGRSQTTREVWVFPSYCTKTRRNFLANPVGCLFPHLHCLLQLDPKHQKEPRHCCVLLCMLRAKQRVGSQ